MAGINGLNAPNGMNNGTHGIIEINGMKGIVRMNEMEWNGRERDGATND